MPLKTLHQVTAATTIGRLMYGSPAWWGYSSERDLNRLDSFIRRAKRGGFLPDDAPSFREIAAQADSSLFKTLISNPNHVLRSLYTLGPTIQFLTIGLETFSPALCFSAHTNNLLLFL